MYLAGVFSFLSFYFFTLDLVDPAHPVGPLPEWKLRHVPVRSKRHQELEHHHEVDEIAPDRLDGHPEIEFLVEIEIDPFHPIESGTGLV